MHGIETRHRGVSEVADLGSDLGDVPIGCALTHRSETTDAISAGVHLSLEPVDTEHAGEDSGYEHDLDGRFHHRLRRFVEGDNSGDDRTGIQSSGDDEIQDRR